MANAPDVELADAIVTDINAAARNWSMTFSAERSWVPLWIGKEELTNLQCLINPWPLVQVSELSRESAESLYSIDFGFAMRLDNKNRVEIDDLRNLIDTVWKRYVVTDFTVASVGRFIPLRRLDEYVSFDPSRLTRHIDGTDIYYVGDFLSMFRVPYLLKEAL